MSDAIGAARWAAISSGMSLGVMAMDFCLLLGDEFRLIWPNVRCFNKYALVYVVTRYAGLAAQIFNIFFCLRMASGVVTSPSHCRMWYRYQAISIQLLLAVVQVLLMLRVYALFLRNSAILCLLILLWIGQSLSMFVSAWLVVPRVAHTDTCYVVKATPAGLYFGVTTMAMNFIVLFMISWRYLNLPLRWIRSGLGYVVLRDSTLSLLTILAWSLLLILCVTGVIETSMNGNVIYYWLFSAMWISLGRLIINQSKVAQVEGDEELTTVHMGSLGTWDSDTHAVDPTGAPAQMIITAA
ncbi:hypothetical protein SCLCIDRAFT_1216224 [Scleroderma citrinum Foug A]|uniref:DUF6533 domain-containing protein n=1 Tax=Scleroderma citrinum Foug A TaxID=1036808 RepID=A0A0C2ZHL0_9AGAM|nr:hypothetical protein SCLCIDRAFT_1216224 [Scleroderma citrinum Foug A]